MIQMNWLKANWLTVLTSLIALICGGDITAGMIQGKSLANVTMIPSLLGGTGALGTILFRWLNSRTVTTRVAPAGLDADVQRMLEAIYTVASSPDVTPDMITDLSNMAAASVIGHANRMKAASMPGRVEVLTASQLDVAGLRKVLGIVESAEVK
jgi:hypothetical protein